MSFDARLGQSATHSKRWRPLLSCRILSAIRTLMMHGLSLMPLETRSVRNIFTGTRVLDLLLIETCMPRSLHVNPLEKELAYFSYTGRPSISLLICWLITQVYSRLWLERICAHFCDNSYYNYSSRSDDRDLNKITLRNLLRLNIQLSLHSCQLGICGYRVFLSMPTCIRSRCFTRLYPTRG
jgi:hypothetical protein